MQILPNKLRLARERIPKDRRRKVDPIVRVGDHNDAPEIRPGDVYLYCGRCARDRATRDGICVVCYLVIR